MAIVAPPASGTELAPGFRFHPTDEELVSYYLKRKLLGRPLRVDAIAEVELYKIEPWDLPPLSRIRSRDEEWYFFSPLDRKPSSSAAAASGGGRTNRATAKGYWKTTGKDREVRRGSKVVGMKKTLVFHLGRAPKGDRTNWVMHEYRVEGADDELAAAGVSKENQYVVCRIFQKHGPGPQNGAQYGAPFVEEEWEGGDAIGLLPFQADGHGSEEVNSMDERCHAMVICKNGSSDEVLNGKVGSGVEVVNGKDGSGDEVTIAKYGSGNEAINDMDDHSSEMIVATQGDEYLQMDDLFQELCNKGENYFDALNDSELLKGIDLDEILNDTNNPGELINVTHGDFVPKFGEQTDYLELNDFAAFSDVELLLGDGSWPSSFCNGTSVDGQQSLNASNGGSDLIQQTKARDLFDDNVHILAQQQQHSLPTQEAKQRNQTALGSHLLGEMNPDEPASGQLAFYDAPVDLAIPNENIPQPTMQYSVVGTVSLSNNFVGSVPQSQAGYFFTPENLSFTPEDFSQNAPKVSYSANKHPTSLSTQPKGGSHLDSRGSSTFGAQVAHNNKNTWNSRITRFLDSISAPPAFAAEYPGATLESSKSSPGKDNEFSHISADVIKVKGSTLDGRIPRSKEVLQIHSCPINTVLHSGLCLFFLSAIMLLISYQVGICIHSR